MTIRAVLLVSSIVSMLCVSVRADRVTLTNGDVLTGTVVSRDQDQVVIEHAVLGAVTIPMAQVAAIAVAGEAAAPGAEAAVAEVKAQAAEGAPVAPVAAADAATEIDAPTPGLFGTNFLAGWTRQLELGATGSEGNTEELSLRAALNLDYEDDRDRWKISGLYYRSESANITTRNEFTGEIVKDWLIPDEDYFFFATAKYEYDQFQAWENRVSGFAGVGYQFHKDDKWDLLGRVGFGGNYEFGDVNDFTPEALLGLEYNLRIKDGQVFSAYTTFFPALDPFFGEFRNLTGVAYTLEIDRNAGLALKLGLENEYESDVEPGEKHNDLKYFVSLVWGF
jgi:putative salt-induced outer membrane protein YdiY